MQLARLDASLLTPKLASLWFRRTPEGRTVYVPSRYKVAHGGRGSSKSWGCARVALTIGALRPLRFLCARELQVSIQESVHHLLCSQIVELGLENFYDPQKAVIRARNGTNFIFRGLRNNITAVKSMEAIDIVWIEEGEAISEESWQTLIPTIRKNGSEIWVVFNPDQEDDPTYQRFVVSPQPDSRVVEVNWMDNPWFPEVLRAEKDWLYSVDPDAAEHVWGGKTRAHSDAQIFKGKWVIEPFEPKPDWDGPYYGADWGFATDPTAAVKCWIGDGRLWIEHEAWGLRVDLDETPALFDRNLPGAREHEMLADSARPETISHLQRHGYPRVQPVEKWAGSVEDGISVLRAFDKIVIHPRCTHMKDEARLYSYKVDRRTSAVLPVVVDAHNHCWDAVRYALNKVIRGGTTGLLEFARRQQREAAARAAAEAAARAPKVSSGPSAFMQQR